MNLIKPNTLTIGEYDGENTGFSDMKKILILAANPKTTKPLRLSEEVKDIKKGLKNSRYGKQFDIQDMGAVELRDFRTELLNYEPHFVHFIGHGKEEGLVVEDPMGMPVLFSAQALAALFKLCSIHVKCVILSACYSAPHAESINQYIDYVIGMESAIQDRASIEFSVGFYDALGAGRSIEDAFEFGCAAILAQFPDIPEHLIPTLKIRKNAAPKDSTPPIIHNGKEMVKINIRIETTGDTFEANVALDANTAAVKKYVINQLKLPKTFEDGFPIPYQWLSKTRADKILDDTKTLRENGVLSDEVFVFLIEVDA